MVLKAALLKLRTTDVPIRFYKDREGRTSHHVRSGWLSPWKAGWINLRAMFIYAPDFFLTWPGILMLTVGLSLVGLLATGPRTIGGIGFNLHWMLLGVTLATVGYSGLQLAMLARVYHGFGNRVRARVLRFFGYNRGMAAGLLMVALGLLLTVGLLLRWYAAGLHLHEISYPGVAGLTLIILGFQTMTFTLILHMILHCRRGQVQL
jgi:hypothetical protein